MLENNNVELLTIEKIREQKYEITTDLNIKSYIPLTEKKILIEKILDICIIEEEIKRIDFSLKEFAYEIMLLKLYSNINIETDDIIEIYDELKYQGIINEVLNLIPDSEKEFIDYVLQKEIEQIQLVDNSLSSVVNKQMNKLISKLPDQKGIEKLIKELPKQINKLDPSKFKFLADAIGWNKGINNA